MMRLTDSAFKPAQANRWFVWGMPLSGKSSLGKKIKKLVPFPVFDLDKEIEKKYNSTISVIFEREGEEAFRKKESELLRELVSLHQEFLIIVGGGTPCFFNNNAFMLSEGTCAFMHTSMEEIIKRSHGSKERPLLQGNAEARLKELYEKRLPIYQTANAEFFSEAEFLEVMFRLRSPDSHRE